MLIVLVVTLGIMGLAVAAGVRWLKRKDREAALARSKSKDADAPAPAAVASGKQLAKAGKDSVHNDSVPRDVTRIPRHLLVASHVPPGASESGQSDEDTAAVALPPPPPPPNRPPDPAASGLHLDEATRSSIAVASRGWCSHCRCFRSAAEPPFRSTILLFESVKREIIILTVTAMLGWRDEIRLIRERGHLPSLVLSILPPHQAAQVDRNFLGLAKTAERLNLLPPPGCVFVFFEQGC